MEALLYDTNVNFNKTQNLFLHMTNDTFLTLE